MARPLYRQRARNAGSPSRVFILLDDFEIVWFPWRLCRRPARLVPARGFPEVAGDHHSPARLQAEQGQAQGALRN